MRGGTCRRSHDEGTTRWLVGELCGILDWNRPWNRRNRRIEWQVDDLPRIGFLEHQGRERREQRMAASMGRLVADGLATHERQIAEHIEDLVAYELVLEAQRVVEHPGFADDDRIHERSAKCETALPQHIGFLQKAK